MAGTRQVRKVGRSACHVREQKDLVGFPGGPLDVLGGGRAVALKLCVSVSVSESESVSASVSVSVSVS